MWMPQSPIIMANELVAPVHARMPVILPPEPYDRYTRHGLS
jgi:putative SOS response-associated peptidase YedK